MSQLLFMLMWVPGLFWLFPYWLFHPGTHTDDHSMMNSIAIIHGVYSAAQIASCIVIIAGLVAYEMSGL